MPKHKPNGATPPKPRRKRVPRAAAFKPGTRWVAAADLSQPRTEWLWFPMIPMGHLRMLDGPKGTGKRELLINIAYAVAGNTIGGTLPYSDNGVLLYFEVRSGNVLWFTSQTDPHRARLEQRIMQTRVASVVPLPKGPKLEIITEVVVENLGRTIGAPRLVICDRSLNCESWHLLKSLHELAQEQGIAIVCNGRAEGHHPFAGLEVRHDGKHVDHVVLSRYRTDLAPESYDLLYKYTDLGLAWVCARRPA